MSYANDIALAKVLQEEENQGSRRTMQYQQARNYGDVHDDEVARRIDQQERDYDLAQKVAQEMTDEELARRLAQAEERHAEAMEQNAAGRIASTWGARRILTYFVPLVFIAIGAVALVIAMGGRDAIPIPIQPSGSFEDDFWEDEDPWQGMTPSQVNKWDVDRGGLKLDVINALDDWWDPYFFRAITEWDSGDPDALSLTTDKLTTDPDCEPVTGKLKVCNGDYGDTRWRGINQILVSNNNIVASAARMNDFFLLEASDAQRQYTMCHEVGHGFGLPHDDEDFFNADRHNCMDYTSRPIDNQSPAEVNFSFLADLYGTVGNRRQLIRRKVEQHDHESLVQQIEQDVVQELPHWLINKLKNLVTELENRSDGNSHEDGWTVLHRSKHGEAHHMELGDGYSVQVHFLLKES